MCILEVEHHRICSVLCNIQSPGKPTKLQPCTFGMSRSYPPFSLYRGSSKTQRQHFTLLFKFTETQSRKHVLWQVVCFWTPNSHRRPVYVLAWLGNSYWGVNLSSCKLVDSILSEKCCQSRVKIPRSRGESKIWMWQPFLCKTCRNFTPHKDKQKFGQ